MEKSKNRAALTLMLFFMMLVFALQVQAQSFGKNKVQYRDFNWEYVQSRHFDVYYYSGSKKLAEYTADVAESSYVALKKDLKYEIGKRIPILVYNSHNEFQQTNVSLSPIDEGVGGFTEVYKDRVIIPFQGRYDEFRHVIHHELTHAYMFQMFYGEGLGSMVMSMTRFQLPLWFWEGMAEYESLGWDKSSDMFMRDAVVNGYVPPIDYMAGFMVYKGGQSLFNYIAEKYGKEKVGEVISKIRASRNLETGLRRSIGLDTKELSDRWQKYLRKRYWPDIAGRDEPEDVSRKLTDHVKNKNFLNNAPTLSPNGDKLIYLSDRADYIDIYLISTIDGKNLGRLVKGQRSDMYDNLHWLRPGAGWSPDSKKIAFASKSKGGKDALFILDVKSRKILQRLIFNLDGIFSPDWSPDGRRIVFMGTKNGQSDLFVYNLKSKKLTKLTNDVFSDAEPAWSPDSRKIAFISDREDSLNPDNDIEMPRKKRYKYDIYVISVDTRQITRITDDIAKEKSPKFSSSGDKIAYISNDNGIDNIFIIDCSTKESYPITNLLTGISQMSWSRDGSRIAFSSFFKGGYDIYILNNPLLIKPESVKLKDTMFVLKESKKEKTKKKVKEQEVKVYNNGYRNYVFGDSFRKGDILNRKKKRSVFLAEPAFKDSIGQYIANKYSVKFSPDIVYGSAGYSQFYGLQGTTQFVFSDILGNHQINLYTDLFYNLKNSNFNLSYYYLPKRTDLGISLFHYSYLFYTYFIQDGYLSYGYLRDRYYGLQMFLSRPFNKYRRINLSVTGMGIQRDWGTIDPFAYYYGYSNDYMKDKGNIYSRKILYFNLGYNTDTVIWGMTGPVNGKRSYLSLTYSPAIVKTGGLDFWTIKGDWRRYIRIKRDYTFALRFTGGVSGGRQPQQFMLGGMMGWINYRYADIPSEFWNNNGMFFFSSFETPMRGASYYSMMGTRFVLSNIEFRFPLIKYLILGGPLQIGFQNIRGVVFTDIGSAWYNDNVWKPFASVNGTGFKLQDMMAGFGFGARVNLGFFLLKYDIAWKTNFAVTSKFPVHYFTLGAEF
ncbi:PD40 domain-containing protein [bacterium]|nr:PD40 domain-containing protein [bacterium]